MAKRTDPATSVSTALERMPSCTRCGKFDADENGYPRWCKECKAEYQRKYRSGDEIRARAEGYREGAETMRETILNGLRKAHPGGMMRNFEIVKFIADTPLPEPVKDQTQSSE